jgi:hypothetical protein
MVLESDTKVPTAIADLHRGLGNRGRRRRFLRAATKTQRERRRPARVHMFRKKAVSK